MQGLKYHSNLPERGHDVVLGAEEVVAQGGDHASAQEGSNSLAACWTIEKDSDNGFPRRNIPLWKTSLKSARGTG